MTDPVLEQLHAEGVDARAGAPLAPLTTLRVGGAARVLAVVERPEDLEAVAHVCTTRGVPWMFLGRGSNVLVADAGWPGVVVVLGRGMRSVSIEGEHVTAGASEPLPALAVRLADAGFAGFAWAAAVPGTVGGGVRMNAGAHGGQMADHLVDVEVFRLRSATWETWDLEALGLAYRHSELPDDAMVVRARLAMRRGQPAEIREEIATIMQWRRTHQPLHLPSCGSVFTNPEGDSAGRLIEAVGAKGLTVGGASVSERHANFIVTRRGATASDVTEVICRVRDEVFSAFEVCLHTEVVLVGSAGHADRIG